MTRQPGPRISGAPLCAAPKQCPCAISDSTKWRHDFGPVCASASRRVSDRGRRRGAPRAESRVKSKSRSAGGRRRRAGAAPSPLIARLRGAAGKDERAAGRPSSKTASQHRGGRRMRPMVLMIGADKGGVGKTTIARTVLDYLAANDAPARAFDAEYPRGTLKRFHPKVTEIVDITQAADQMKMLDTLTESEAKISVIDVRAGLLSRTLRAFTDVGFFDLARAGEFDFGLFHVVGPSVSSLDEIGDVIPFTGGRNYFVVKNFINETSFFEWNPQVYRGYFKNA